MKKAVELKEQFPEVPITIVIPSTTTDSCSVAVNEDLMSNIKSQLPNGATVVETTSKITVPESGFGDHYIEFGGYDARRSGEREVSGIKIVL